jgi:hypothetical protein
LPTISAACKKDKITLNKAIAQQNNRSSIASVQKAGRASERAKKRVAEVAEEEVSERSNSEASRVVTRAAKKAKVTGGSGRRKK